MPEVGDLPERETGLGVDSLLANESEPSQDRDIDVLGIELQPIADPPRALGGDDGGAAADETIQDGPTTARAIPDGVHHEFNRFDGGVKA